MSLVRFAQAQKSLKPQTVTWLHRKTPDEGSRKLISQEVDPEHINKAQRPEKKSNNVKQLSAMAGIKGIFIFALLVKLRGPFSFHFSEIKTLFDS